MSLHYLYKITNTVNNKIYIGQSNDHEKRWKKHINTARNIKATYKQYVHHAMAKHGVENFTFDIIAMCQTREDANYVETILIVQYNSRNNALGYNIAPGGDNMGGRPCSPETRRKISEAQKGKIIPEESKRRMSEGQKGRKFSDEHKAKIAEGNRKPRPSMQGRPSWNAGLSGGTLTEEHKNKIGEGNRKPRPSMQGRPSWNKGKPMSEEARAKLAETNTGKKASVETRQKMSDSHKNIPNEGRFKPGMPAHNAIKFSEEDIANIKTISAKGTSICAIAKLYNRGKSTIKRVILSTTEAR